MGLGQGHSSVAVAGLQRDFQIRVPASGTAVNSIRVAFQAGSLS